MKIAKAVFLTALLSLGLACGYSSHATTPATPGTVPTIATLNPNNGTANTAFPLVIAGTGFNGNATVNFGGALTPTQVTATQITVMVPATADMNSGPVSVTVTNPGTMGGIYGGGTQPETSTPVTFTVN